MFCPLTTSMRFLPPPPSEKNCYNIGTRHAKSQLGLIRIVLTQGVKRTPFNFFRITASEVTTACRRLAVQAVRPDTVGLQKFQLCEIGI